MEIYLKITKNDYVLLFSEIFFIEDNSQIKRAHQ